MTGLGAAWYGESHEAALENTAWNNLLRTRLPDAWIAAADRSAWTVSVMKSWRDAAWFCFVVFL